jgi:hypothetical protein
MRRKIAVQIVLGLVVAAGGCAADVEGGDETGTPRTSYCEENGLSDAICALRTGSETLTCKSAPWSYVRVRTGLSLRIACSAQGDFPGTGNLVDRVQTKSESEKLYDLAHDSSMWPDSECTISPLFVDSYVYPGTGIPYQQKRITATMHVEGGAVLLVTDAPELAPSTTLADCQENRSN